MEKIRLVFYNGARECIDLPDLSSQLAEQGYILLTKKEYQDIGKPIGAFPENPLPPLPENLGVANNDGEVRQKEWDKEKLRIVNILISIPVIKKMIKQGAKWERLKIICEPLGLIDTSFREHPKESDYLLDSSYWLEKLGLSYLKPKRSR